MDSPHMTQYKDISAIIFTAADEHYSALLFDLCDSLGRWIQYVTIIDIGLGQDSLRKLALRGVKLRHPLNFRRARRLL